MSGSCGSRAFFGLEQSASSAKNVTLILSRVTLRDQLMKEHILWDEAMRKSLYRLRCDCVERLNLNSSAFLLVEYFIEKFRYCGVVL